MSSPSHPTFDILTPTEFAERLKIGRTKLFELVRKGILRGGVDYFRNGRVLRFVWSPDLVKTLNEKGGRNHPHTGVKAGSHTVKQVASRSAVDLTY